ncbi:BgTH12-03201 [Blumeria graminis f. sp. triticale]|uniref:BgTH12-03201 n=1 Tax=Blumeria graminis f. sp. triticale TaxID=1689686 RepID=A0A9W4D3Q6_BLUGR|nr:BgTH12-03201 [Blumeria graminis f. sp. triticale]
MEGSLEAGLNDYRPLGLRLRPYPVDVSKRRTNQSLNSKSAFYLPPLLSALIFNNSNSDARDHCANERTFLSYLRLSTYMALIACAIVISFHFKDEPSKLELRVAKPLGLVFWSLSVACLGVGAGTYINTVDKYSRQVAIVQNGWKTLTVLTAIAASICGSCIFFLINNGE